jgi:hypothetical protein
MPGYVHERPTNALILFKVYSISYLLRHVSALSMPSSGTLHVPAELFVHSESLLTNFCTMDGGGFYPFKYEAQTASFKGLVSTAL